MEISTQAPVDDFSIRLEFFSGPMDLLLHLVHQQEVSIEEVSMRLIAEQYLAVISHSRFLDLERAAEYLVIAATLISIKSARLLPGEFLSGEAENPEESGEAFLEELRARLRAYEITKKQAQALSDLPQFGIDTFSRIDRSSLLPTPEMLAQAEDVRHLGTMFGRLLKRIGATANMRISVEPVSVVSWMMRIVDSLSLGAGSQTAQGHNPESAKRPSKFGQSFAKKASRFSFSNLLRNYFDLKLRSFVVSFPKSFKSESDAGAPLKQAETTLRHRYALVGSFIAVLELMKRGLLTAEQDTSESDIFLRLHLSEVGENPTEMQLQSEFDSADETRTEMTASAITDNKEVSAVDGSSNVIDIRNYRRSPTATSVEEAVSSTQNNGSSTNNSGRSEDEIGNAAETEPVSREIKRGNA